ncbi:dienelactone hydrolase family protein [Mucilaginibacter jinjuensis]|uniref:Dienelactone hydrolase family protein n=1 Tax=Mucilaginibacter jinjuensis TaxID=1176721 RepID=A0ABY7TC02_9SPHI|nr:dienelactone hydrolase family protein [Mucilaginibacter jinjuensis]WCT13506.1 dienelactone hydrolase family protein [Mucilaginibacter jinjuensis]
MITNVRPKCLKGKVTKLVYFPVFAVLFFQSAFGQSDFTKRDKNFLEALKKKDFVTAQTLTSANLNKQLGINGLKDAATQINKQIGELNSYDTTAISDSKNILRFVVHFEKADLIMQFANSESGIEGFFLLPLDQAYHYPTYEIKSKEKIEEIKLVLDTVNLPAILTLPNDSNVKHPAVVFIGGSGPTDYDETIGIIKPFKDISIALANCGIVSLRYDKQSKVYPERFKRNYTVQDEYEPDLKSALAYLETRPEVDKRRIFLIGHSLGATLVPMLIATNPNVKGGIMLEANAEPLHHIYLKQLRHLQSLNGTPSDSTIKAVAKDVDLLNHISASDSSLTLLGAKGSYWLSLKMYNPFKVINSLRAERFLIIQGGLDYQVDSDNLRIWQSKLKKGNTNFLFFSNLNHALVEGTKAMSPQEYYIPANVPIDLIQSICNWVLQ